MDRTKIQTIPTAYFISVKRLVQDNFRALFLYKWKQTEKENVVAMDNTMIPEIVRIQTEGFETRRINDVKRYSKKFKKTFYVILSDDKVVRYCFYYLKPVLSLRGIKKNSVIYSIAIDRNFRRKGFGEKLLAESIKEMKLNKISSVLLYANIENTPATRLYEKVGFRIIKEIEDVCGQNKKCYEMEVKLA